MSIKASINIIKYAIVFVLFLLGNSVNSMFGILGLSLSVLIIIFNENKENIYFLALLLPNIRIMDCLNSIQFINVLFLIISIKYITFLNNKSVKLKINKKFSMISFFVLAYELSHILIINDNTKEQIFTAINLAFDVFAFLIILSDNWSISEFEKVVKHLLLGCVLSTLIFCIANPSTLTKLFGTGYRLSAYGNDPNYLSAYILVGTAGVILCVYKRKITFQEVILLLLSVIVGLFTASKMCIFSLIGIYLVFIIYLIMKRDYKKLFGIIIKLTPFVLLALYFFGEQITYLVEKFFLRFKQSFSDTEFGNLTSGRSELLINYLNLIFNNFTAFIYGRSTLYFNYYANLGFHFVAHNTYLDFILSWGVVGSIIFIVILGVSLKDILSYKNKFINYLPLLVFLLMMTALSLMSSDMFWYLLSFVLIPLRKSFKTNKLEESNNENINNSSNVLS